MFDPIRDQIENTGGPFGQWVRVTLVAAIVLALVSLARRTILRGRSAALVKWLKRNGDLAHLSAGFLTLGLGLVHAWYSPSLNVLIWAGFACIAVLVALGIAVQWHLVRAFERHPAWTRGAKWALSVAAVALILIGHAQLPPPAWAQHAAATTRP